MRAQLHEVHPTARTPVDVVPLAVDLDRFHPADGSERPALRARWGVDGEGPVLLTVRRLVRRMGLENLLAAVPALRERHPGLRVLIGGRGYLAGELERRVDELGVRDAVRLLGFVPEEDLPELYRVADLFVLPTLELEGFGVVTLEAFASGVPVIATPVGANPEVAGGLDPALLAASTSAADLAGAIGRGLAAAPRLRGAAREHVEQRYSPAAVGRRVEELLERVAGR